MANTCQNCSVRKEGLFKNLKSEELEELNNSKSVYTLKKGQAVFSEGENINGIFCISRGVCKLTKLCANGNEQVVRLSISGELLGQRSLISEEKTGLSAVAINDMDVCFIPKDNMLDLFNRNNNFSMGVMKSICGNLKEANNHLVDMAQKSVKQRLAGTLLYLRDRFGVGEDGSLNIAISREELSGIIGTATESCIRLLSEFRKAGKVRLSGKKIILADIDALRKLDHQES